jgi:hypothetical protein
MPRVQRPSEQQQNIYHITDDTIVSIEEDGFEDVFDIEVAETENFIANGLISHNTRWHYDDLIGRLEAKSHSGEGQEFDIINLPALAGEEDPLGRDLGAALWPLRYDEEALADIKKGMTPFGWSALFQQKPTPEDGGAIQASWWRYYDSSTLPPEFDQLIQSWDLAFKDLKKSDYTVGQVWGRKGANY